MSDASEPLSIDTEIDLKAAFDSAIVHHQAGRLSQAELLYRMVLRTLPLHPDANHNLGVIAVQLGQPEHALPLLNTALTQDLTQGRFWISYIDALLRAGHLDEADQWLAQGRKSGLAGPQVDELAQRLAVAREPKPLAKAGKNRKAKHAQPPLAVQQKLVALFNQGQTEACEQLARELTETYPRHPLAWKTLGAVVTQLGRTAEGVQIMRTAAELAPQDVELLSNLGVTLVMMGQLEEAEHCYRRALKLQPHSSSLHAFLADTLFLLLRYPQAEQHARKAIELNPNNEIAYHNLGSVLRASSKISEAESVLRHALSLAWNYPAAHANLANVLKDQGRLVEAEKHLRLALDMQPNNRMIRSNLLFATIYSHTVTPEQLYADHCVYGRMISAMAGPSMHLSRDLSPQPRRIGFVSADLFHHAVSYFVEPVWDGLRERGCTVLAYYNGKHYDGATARLHRKCDVWRDVVGMPDEQLAQQIVDDEVDVLIDLSGHTGGNRLPVFAREPAPLQVTWLGHPATTGLPGMHWRITDVYADPPGMTEHLNTERLYRMPEVFCCYHPQKEPALAEQLPVERTGRFTFGCFNNFAKVTPPVIACWSSILRQLPQSRLLLEVHGAEDVAFAADIRQRFVDAGASPAQIDILPRQSGQQYVLYREVDLALDPFPCSGGTTSCDSLWMGTPFVTLAGRSFVSRMGVTFLKNVGLDELIADNEADYQAKALALAQDLPRLRALREGLRERVRQSPLMDAPRFAGHFAQALMDMWAEKIAAQT